MVTKEQLEELPHIQLIDIAIQCGIDRMKAMQSTKKKLVADLLKMDCEEAYKEADEFNKELKIGKYCKE